MRAVIISIEHNSNILGESNPIKIEAGIKEPTPIYDVNFSIKIPVLLNDRNSIDLIVSIPILINLSYVKQDGNVTTNVLNTERKKKELTKSSKTVIGLCNVDLMPILLGENLFTEKLILETMEFKFDGTSSSWPNLPYLTIKVKQQDEEQFFPSDLKYNFVNITVESIFNPPSWFTDNLVYKAGTIIYGEENEETKRIIHDGGKLMNNRDICKTKCWNCLFHLQSRAKLSKYKIDYNYNDVKNTLDKELKLQNIVENDVTRIEWNSMSRHILFKDSIEKLRNQYQCYVDLSELLFPGRRKTRIASQLYTYNPIELMEKTGYDKNIFLIDNNQTKEPKEKDKRGKTSTKDTSVVSEAETLTGEPVITKNNEPVFVIIEIEFNCPLVPCRLAKDFSNLIDELITPTDKKPYYPYSINVVEDQYAKCIETLFHVLTESYRDELTCFVQYLYKTGVYLSIRNALKTKVILLLDHKFQMPSYTLDSCEEQDSSMISDSNRLYFYAEEAYELGNIDEARKYYTTIIDQMKNNSDAWINYAIFLLKIEDTERAEECCREAICLNNRHKISLLVYGAILMKKRLYREAEIFFRSITNFYPRFVEGWMILHLFYIRTDYYSGIDVTFRIAKECMKDKDQDISINNQEPFAWSMIHCPRDSIYTMTITFLLKLHLYDLAGIALAEEMSLTGRSTHLLYYMAVEHYLLHRYEDALSHLKEAQCQYGLDYSISCLMGHCYFKHGDLKEAINYYEFANMVFDRPDDIYLMQLRMGLCYERQKDYEKANKVLLNACQSSPTSISWFHLGISFYKLNQLKEAELALIEANKIDNCNADIWGYLCLLNLSLKRYDEFILCYRQAIKYNLKNNELLKEIREFMKLLNYEVEVLQVK
ncbi:PREDICTED: cilia- and flagella-associated protein 70 [Polistes dominula]|uniref:Cilia- and flagella-associated protein 70 n=1 Tax=Polistes dominula TaxID=743375 RepID=A0ABM1J4J0_POLDO|nr:PREDICTED: cilia- and flagella-associated protein 70 [Polistes dominula]